MITSKNTSVNQNKVPKLFTTITKKIGWKPHTINLDMGGGKYNTATDFLRYHHVLNLILDPYNRSAQENMRVVECLLTRYADTATISNVLNVVQDTNEISKLLECVHSFLKTGGMCFINCYHAPKEGVSKQDCFQRAKPLDWYVPIVQKIFGNVQKKYGMLIAIK